MLLQIRKVQRETFRSTCSNDIGFYLTNILFTHPQTIFLRLSIIAELAGCWNPSCVGSPGVLPARKPEARTIYWSLVRQLLKFSSTVWSPYLTNKLQKIHDRFVRLSGVCMGIRYRQVRASQLHGLRLPRDKMESPIRCLAVQTLK